MKLKFDYTYMSKDIIGEHGVDLSDIERDKDFITDAFNSVIENKGKDWQGWTDLPFTPDNEISQIIDFAECIKKRADSLVVLGIGGSALGTMCCAHALLHLKHNSLSRKSRGKVPEIHIEDNIDPERMMSLLETANLKKTYFNVITKSGETCETLSQFLIIYDLLKKVLGKKRAKEHIFVTTTDGKGSLYDAAVKEGFKIFGIPAGVGGRFSVFSPAGLLPLAIVGIDIRVLLKGAQSMDGECAKTDPLKNPALLTAYLQYKTLKGGKNISVMMPYADSLKYMSDFFAQLWGESLGKKTDKNGNIVHCGLTPVKALGVTDQHSQIQLYTEGPFDKVVTFLAVEEYRDNIEIPDDESVSDFAYLKKHSLLEVITAERKATAYAIAKAGRPNMTVILPCVCDYTVGELLTFFMYQTAFMGAMLNVNTYDQPGVEEGKKATYSMLGRIGYEKMSGEIKSVHVLEQ